MRPRTRFRVRAGIPSASMADLALLLLIFFMTTTLFEVQAGPVVALPPARHGEERSREGAATVRVSEQGVVFLDGEEVTVAELGGRLRAASGATPPARILLFADRALPFAQLSPVLDALRGPQAMALVIAIEPRADERAEPITNP